MSGRSHTVIFAAIVIAAVIAGFLIRRGRGGPHPAASARVQAERGGGKPHAHLTVGSALLKDLEPLYESYFAAQMALAGDDHAKATKAFAWLEKKTANIDHTMFKHPVHDDWMRLSVEILERSKQGAGSKDIEGARDAFYHLSKAVIELHGLVGHSGNDFYLTFCPVARDSTGAYWIQEVDTVYNSFYGTVRLRCGSIEEKLPAAGGE